MVPQKSTQTIDLKVLPPACLSISLRITKIMSRAPKTHFYTQEWTQNVCVNRFYAAIWHITPPDEQERVFWNGHLHWLYTVWDNWIHLKSIRQFFREDNSITRQYFSPRFVLKHIYLYISLREKRSYIDLMTRFFAPDRYLFLPWLAHAGGSRSTLKPSNPS